VFCNRATLFRIPEMFVPVHRRLPETAPQGRKYKAPSAGVDRFFCTGSYQVCAPLRKPTLPNGRLILTLAAEEWRTS
jgi:hypothetical protein